jgi:hypothetical protein
MKGEFDSPSKPSNQAFRDGWDNAFGCVRLRSEEPVTEVVNKRRSAFDVYIGRGSIFGNPFTHLPLDRTKAEFHVATRAESISAFEAWFRKRIEAEPDLHVATRGLYGKRLGCFCKPLPCHGDVLVKIAAELNHS